MGWSQKGIVFGRQKPKDYKFDTIMGQYRRSGISLVYLWYKTNSIVELFTNLDKYIVLGNVRYGQL